MSLQHQTRGLHIKSVCLRRGRAEFSALGSGVMPILCLRPARLTGRRSRFSTGLADVHVLYMQRPAARSRVKLKHKGFEHVWILVDSHGGGKCRSTLEAFEDAGME